MEMCSCDPNPPSFQLPNFCMLSRNHAMENERKDAEMERRKGKRREWIPDERSPFSDADRQRQLLLCVFALKSLCLTAWIRTCLLSIKGPPPYVGGYIIQSAWLL
jgi:hypothetical protein